MRILLFITMVCFFLSGEVFAQQFQPIDTTLTITQGQFIDKKTPAPQPGFKPLSGRLEAPVEQKSTSGPARPPKGKGQPKKED